MSTKAAAHKPQASALPKRRVWLMAIRVPTLPAAVAPVLVGSAYGAAHGAFRPWVFLAALLSALLIQIGTNLTNDLFDFRKGADTKERVGPVRVTVSGLLTPREVAIGSWVTFGLAFLLGLYLVWVGGWPVFLVGVTGIAAGILYTGGPWPLGYHGLGDLFAFLYFGVFAVVCTGYLHLDAVPAALWWASLPVACIVTAILVSNNLRDIETDRKAGKRTLAVRLGPTGAKIEYTLLLFVAYVVPAAMWASGHAAAYALLPWLTLPIAAGLVRRVWTASGAQLIPALKGTGKLHLLFSILFSAGVLLS